MPSTCNRTSQKKKHKKKSTLWKGLKTSELTNMAETIKTHFNWDYEPRQFQIDAIKAQLTRQDVLVHAGTGSGKTAIAAGPYAFGEVKGMTTFFVSPLIVLQQEQVVTFTEEFGLRATAINSENGGCSKDTMKDVVDGKWDIVILSPEMLLSKRFIKHVIRNPEFAHRVLSVIVDEAHVVSHWGSGFRKRYATLGILRALLPKGTPMVAMSATLPPRVRDDVLKKLQYNRNTYLYVNVGNDRHNVSLSVRAIQHPMNTFEDLAFVIPDNVKDPSEIPKTFIYSDDIDASSRIEDYLHSRCPESWRNSGDANPIRPYNAIFSTTHRAKVMRLFREGVVRVLICTDAAGMGCNIPDIDVVVQWKLPATLSSFVQRAGRAARGAQRAGLAVLLVEPSVYKADIEAKMGADAPSSTGKKQRKRTVRQSETYPSGEKGYANAHGVKRGSYGGLNDTVPPLNVPIDFDAVDEGLYSFVQTSRCRRSYLTKIYGNQEPHPTVSCCDICEPRIFDQTRPSNYKKPKRRSAIEQGEVNKMVRDALVEWRKEKWREAFPGQQFGPTAILKDATLDLLASVGPIHRVLELEALLDRWVWFGRFGDSLLACLRRLPIPAMVPKEKTKGKGKGKRTLPTVTEGAEKQRRVDVARTESHDTRHAHPTHTIAAATPMRPPLMPLPAPTFYPDMRAHYPHHQYQWSPWHQPALPGLFMQPQQHPPAPIHAQFAHASAPQDTSSDPSMPQTPQHSRPLVFRMFDPHSSSSSGR